MTNPGTELRKEKTVGVVLFQLGGPDSPEAVEPFLYNLFCDPDIIQLPLGRARAAIARLLASKRASKVQHHYAAIGGRSPIRELTEQQASALQAELSKSLRARVVLAMRYWHPLTEEAVAELEPAGPDGLVDEPVDEPVDELVLLPLYPQYSKTTTGSSLNEWNRKYTTRPGVPVHTVAHFYDHPVYIRALVEKINQGLERFSPPGQPAPGVQRARRARQRRESRRPLHAADGGDGATGHGSRRLAASAPALLSEQGGIGPLGRALAGGQPARVRPGWHCQCVGGSHFFRHRPCRDPERDQH